MAQKKKHVSLTRIITYTPTHIISTIATIAMLFMIVWYPLSKFFTRDPVPEFIANVPKRQAAGVQATTRVKAGLHYENFREFDILKNKFVADVIVWFLFDPTAISLDTIGKFSFERGEIKWRSEPNTRMIGSKLFARYDVRVDFSTNLDHARFPLTDHRIYLVLLNQYLSPSEAIFDASRSGFSTSKSLYTGGWKPTKRTIFTGYSQARLDKHDVRTKVSHPRVIFGLAFRRTGFRKSFLVFVPIFLLFFLGLFSLLIDIRKNERLATGLSTASMTALLAYRFVIERISPEVGYFTLTDHLYTIFLGLTFIVFLLNIFSVKYLKKYDFIHVIKCASFLAMQVGLLVFWYWIIFYWGT